VRAARTGGEVRRGPKIIIGPGPKKTDSHFEMHDALENSMSKKKQWGEKGPSRTLKGSRILTKRCGKDRKLGMAKISPWGNEKKGGPILT